MDSELMVILEQLERDKGIDKGIVGFAKYI